MNSSWLRSIYFLFIIIFIFSLVFQQKSVVAVGNDEDEVLSDSVDEETTDLVDEDIELEDPGFDESVIDTGLEVEEVELAERDEVAEDEIEAHLAEMKRMSENEYLELYLHETTAEIAVKVKESGKLWFSNPIDRGTDTVATGENRAIIDSQFTLIHYHMMGQTSRIHSNESVVNGQFEIEMIENGVKVIYTVGDTSKGLEMIPRKISKERFETLILDKVDDVTRKELLSRFEYIEEEDAYKPREVSFTSKIGLSKTLKVFEEVDYTEEDLAIDNAEADDSEEVGAGKAHFVIPLQYELDGENLIVTVIGEEIEQNESFPISEIQMLGFFGAANEFKEGYSFVPDGSGALIQLNNEKVNFQPYLQKVYGKDGATYDREQSEVSEVVRLPIFGMKQGDQAFIAVIEEGDSIASIEADVAGRLNSYNTVNSRFSLKERSQVTLTGGERSSTITMFQNGGYQENMRIRYGFLEGDKANYSGMAAYYRAYLTEKDQLTRLEPTEALPFYLELVGSILKRKTILGIPYQSAESVTNFKEAEQILTELTDAGVHNINLRYSGWFNGSLKHTAPKNVKVDSEIGGKKGLKELNVFLQKNKINLYPDVAFLKVLRKSASFNTSRDGSRQVNRRTAIQYPFNPASFRRDISKIPSYVLSPTKLPAYVEGFAEDYAKLHIDGLSLRDMGNELNSDFRDKKVVNREQAKGIIQEQLGLLENQFTDLLVEGGNALALPYANHILYAPSSSSGFNITDESIPFYQIVIHGSIDHAASPVNLSDQQNIEYALLKALETGSNVHFTWFYEDASVIKDTEFNDLLSSNYQVWFDEAVEMYQEVNTVLNDVRTETITAHEEIEKGVYQTTYSNNKSILVNYNDEAVQINDVVIEPESYALERGGVANVSKK